MDKVLRSKRILMVPIIVVVVLGLIIMFAVLPMVKMNPKNVPIGLVVEDQGQMGHMLAEKFSENVPDMISLKRYDSIEVLQSAMDEREVYGALVLPEDFSSKIATLQSENPEKAYVEIYINEGANTMLSSVIETALTNIVGVLNTQLSSQMLMNIQQKTEELREQIKPLIEAQGENSPLAQIADMISPIEPNKVLDFAQPIEFEVVKYNETGILGNAPIAYIMATWFTSIIGAVVLYLIGTKRTFASRKEKLKFHTFQSIMPFVYAIIAGYILAWYSTLVYGFELESLNKVALFIALCVATFIYMIFVTLRWLRLPSIILFVLLMFFSMPSIMLAPEVVPEFYRDYIFSWLPMRFYADGIRDLLFFSKDVINSYSIVLVWILIVSFILVWVKNLIEKQEENLNS